MSLELYSVGIRLKLLDSVSMGLLGLSSHFLTLNRTIGKTREELKGMEAQMLRLKGLALSGGFLLGAGIGTLSLFKGPIEEAKAFQNEFTRFAALGLGDKVNDQAAKFAQGMQVMGQSATDNMR